MKTWMHGIAGSSVLRALICVCVVGACSRQPATRDKAKASDVPTRVSTPESPCAAWAPQALSAPGAFDLALTSEGALVVWSPAAGGLVAQPLDRRGAAIAEPGAVTIANGQRLGERVIELAATSAAGEIGLAWVEARSATHVARVGHANERAPGLVQAQELGAVEHASAARGRVVIASTEDGEIQVTWRNERSACQAQTGVCSHYSRRSVGSHDPSERGLIVREMLNPCDAMLIGSLWADGSWYEGVCHRSPERVAYLFSFRPEISYAEATDLLAGCDAFVMSRAQVGAAVWGQCADGVAVAARSHLPATPPVLRGVTETIRCNANRPVLVAHATSGAFELPLAAATDGIGAALPDVPSDARAVWTGSHVIAAYEEGGALRVATGACTADGFAWCGLRPRP